MRNNRIMSWLLLWSVGIGLALGGILTDARAQVGPPFLSNEIKEVDKHIFAPADLSTFDQEPVPNTGYWAKIGYAQMWISAPDRATIGNPFIAPRLVFDGSGNGVTLPSARAEFNSTDTSIFTSDRSSGHRTSFGYMGDDTGWNVTVFDMGGSSNEFDASNSEVILFDPVGGLTGFVDGNGDGFDDDLDSDLTFGRSGVDTTASGTPNAFAPPDLGDIIPQALVFTTLNARSETETWGVELNREVRLGRGGNVSFGYGVHYFNFDEGFLVTGTGGLLADSFWDTSTDNDILGPKFSARWQRTRGRWTMEVQSAFTAALNFQTIRQNGQFNGNTMFSPFFTSNTVFNHAAHLTEFTPIIELALMSRYQVTSKFYAEIGWRGMFLDNVARPQTMVNYEFPRMGILTTNNRQELFINGFVINMVFNR